MKNVYFRRPTEAEWRSYILARLRYQRQLESVRNRSRSSSGSGMRSSATENNSNTRIKSANEIAKENFRSEIERWKEYDLPEILKRQNANNLRLNLGGEGEAEGFIDVNPLTTTTVTPEQIRARNPTGGFVRAGAENLPFEENSTVQIVAYRFPGIVLNRNSHEIASEIKRVLKPGGTAEINTISGKIPENWTNYGFVISNNGQTATYTQPMVK